MNNVIVVCDPLPSRYLPAKKLTIETLEQGVKYVQS